MTYEIIYRRAAAKAFKGIHPSRARQIRVAIEPLGPAQYSDPGLATVCDVLRLAQQRGEVPTVAEAKLFGLTTVARFDGVNLQLLSDPTGLPRELAKRVAP